MVTFRRAARADLPSIVRMLADDPLGATRESAALPLAESYYAAFDDIDADVNNELIVAQLEDRVVGVLQLTFIPSITYRGSTRAQIEGVRIDAGYRQHGVGKRMVEWAINRARERGCDMVQLTTNKTRPDAIAFYEALGFTATHEGMKKRVMSDE
jgi:GNAT superfamily N-acetyltransferase